jgi:aspartate carbamoyltransferase catalytic subunit
MKFTGMNLLSADQFDIPGLETVFRLADRMPPIKRRAVRCQLLGGYILGNFFFEDSTRTRLGARMAFMRLGGSIQPLTRSKKSEMDLGGEVVMDGTSMSKGESYADTMRVLGSYCDIMIVRHPRVGQVAEAAQFAGVPTINGGDGPGEHPTQGLLDIYTMQNRLGKIDGITVAIVNDLSQGRTTHSLTKLLSLYEGIRFIFIAHESLQMPSHYVTDLKDRGFQVDETDDINAIAAADVIYMTRVQRERFDSQDDYEAVRGQFILTPTLVDQKCKPGCVIAHPGPIIEEIDPAVYAMPQFAVWEQVENGVLTKMALFLLILDKLYKLV